ncbi:hypothetical protein [Mucilaginibacter antarcticus]|uniref:hypothetical protein n=1 Tax=Mucilaginibacter antarcticus TaxID=1855725 RepID=UPI003628AC57
MLKDELKVLAAMAAGFAGMIDKSEVLSTAYLTAQETHITKECQRIKKVWTDLLFSQQKDHVLRRYMPFQQQVILETADFTFELISSAKDKGLTDDNALLKLPLLMQRCLLDLRDFQVQYFQSFFDQNGKIPLAGTLSVRKKMTVVAEELSAGLENSEIDPGLKVCVMDYLSSIIHTDGKASLSYRAAGYLMSFTETLKSTISIDGSPDLTQSVTEALFYLNFNHNSFCRWYQDNVATKKSIMPPDDRLPMLLKQLLILKSMPVMTNTAFDPNVAAIHIQVENWMIEFLRQESFNIKGDDYELPEKLELNLTVAQMALLVRLLYEEGVFTMTNITAILKFFQLAL